MGLLQKVILVTGASSGIGAATAQALDAAGASRTPRCADKQCGQHYCCKVRRSKTGRPGQRIPYKSHSPGCCNTGCHSFYAPAGRRAYNKHRFARFYDGDSFLCSVCVFKSCFFGVDPNHSGRMGGNRDYGERKQNFITRLFTKPKTPQDVARHLVKLIRNPKTLVYSDISVKTGAFISNIPGFRLNIARQLAENAREKMSIYQRQGLDSHTNDHLFVNSLHQCIHHHERRVLGPARFQCSLYCYHCQCALVPVPDIPGLENVEA